MPATEFLDNFKLNSREAEGVLNQKAFKDSGEGTHALAAKTNSNDPVKLVNLLKEVLDKQNLNRAYAKILSNKASQGLSARDVCICSSTLEYQVNRSAQSRSACARRVWTE